MSEDTEEAMSKRKQNQSAREDSNRAEKRDNKFNIFAFILCVLIAFVIWLNASNAEDNNKETTIVIENAQAAATVALTETL